MPSVADARRLVQLKDDMREKQALADTAERLYKDAEAAFWEDLDETKEPSVKKDLGEPYGIVTFTRSETITGNVLDPEAAVKSLTELGLADAILGPASVRKKVLNAKMREWLKSGAELPEGVDFSKRRYITVTKSKPKAS